MNIPLVSLIGLGTWYLSTKANKKVKDAAQLSLMPIALDAKSFKDIKLGMQIINPTDSEFKIDALAANIYYKDKLIGTIVRNSPFTIKPTNDSLIYFGVDVKGGAAIAAAITILADKKAVNKSVKVLGSYKYLGFNFPIDKEIKLYAKK